MQFAFYDIPSWGLSENIETKVQTTCFYLFFFKTKGLELESLPHFLYDSLKKNISYILYIYYLIYFLYFLYKNICYILLPDQI